LLLLLIAMEKAAIAAPSVEQASGDQPRKTQALQTLHDETPDHSYS